MGLDDPSTARRHGTNQHAERGDGGTHSSARDADAILARLKRDQPEMAQRVVDGEISPNVN